jgi:hypothetical protein
LMNICTLICGGRVKYCFSLSDLTRWMIWSILHVGRRGTEWERNRERESKRSVVGFFVNFFIPFFLQKCTLHSQWKKREC